MSVVKKIKAKYAEFQLRKQLKSFNRKKGNLNFETAKSVALLFDPTEEREFDLIKNFIKQLRDQKKVVKSIGYFDLKQIPPMQYSKLEYDFISQKELNSWGRPAEDYIKTFMNEEFDMIINLNLKNHFPLRYIAALSKAKVKIGIYHPNYQDYYDLMINIESDYSLKNYLKQLNHYLKLIHT